MLACVQTSPLPQKKSGEVTSSLLPIFFSEGVGGVCTQATKMPSFSIASCSNGAEIHSMELLYFREKTNWFSKEVRPLKPYKNEDKHILQETGRGEGGNTDI